MGFRITRSAEASWQGTTEDGGGRLALGSGAFEGPFTLRARVEETPGTNPEELIGAANAGCFTMSLASLLGDEGHPAADLRTTARVRLEQQDEGSIGLQAPITGQVAQLGGEQLHFAQFALAQYNQKNGTNIKLVQGDTQLTPPRRRR